MVLDNEPLREEKEDSKSTDGIIRSIHHLNDEIDDESVSERIDRIERVTASILHTLKAHPERTEDARRFMNYYLPATMKLLDAEINALETMMASDGLIGR